MLQHLKHYILTHRCAHYDSDNDNRKQHKYVCITTNQPDTESDPNPNPTTKQHAVVSIRLNIVACPMYPETIRNYVNAPFYYCQLSLSCCLHTCNNNKRLSTFNTIVSQVFNVAKSPIIYQIRISDSEGLH